MRTGIVIAMDKEFARVRQLLDGAAETVRGGRAYTTGTMGGNEIVMVQCGVGKVNAAIWYVGIPLKRVFVQRGVSPVRSR